MRRPKELPSWICYLLFVIISLVACFLYINIGDYFKPKGELVSSIIALLVSVTFWFAAGFIIFGIKTWYDFYNAFDNEGKRPMVLRDMSHNSVELIGDKLYRTEYLFDVDGSFLGCRKVEKEKD